jgi:hypothetical protein
MRPFVSFDREERLMWRIRVLVLVFIAGLVLSGATAIPLRSELNWAAHLLEQARDSDFVVPAGLIAWIAKVRDALNDTYAKYPFLAYGTDWLAFGHFIIALAFIGALRDPVRNVWLFTFGIAACVLVIPFALIFGAMRGIPFYWRLIDCSFGVIGIVPVWLCRRCVRELSG